MVIASNVRHLAVAALTTTLSCLSSVGVTACGGSSASGDDAGESSEGATESGADGSGTSGDEGNDPCADDEYVDSGICTVCPPGSTNEGGDDPSGPDTVCDDECTEVVGLPCAVFEESYLKASNSESEDLFGYSVSLSRDTLVVGAPGESSEDNGDPSSGAAYVFVREDGAWTQEALIKASNKGNGDAFGLSVAVDGDTLVVGAPGEASAEGGVVADGTNNLALQSGAAYVFTRAGGRWTEQAYLKASNPDGEDFFGTSVSLDGDTLAVGAPNEDSGATGIDGEQLNDFVDAGAVYVFARVDSVWSQQAYVKASNTGAGDLFGQSLSFDGETLAVGAPGHASDSGAVYVFSLVDGTWAEAASLVASNSEPDDQFGTSVSVGGDVLAVSAPGEDSAAVGVNGDQQDNGAESSGAVYVFERPAADWEQRAYVKASNTDMGDLFGFSLSIDGGALVVGSPVEASQATGLDGNQADNNAPQGGAIYLFTSTDTTWSQRAYVKSSNTSMDDGFGSALAFDGDEIAVGARFEGSDAVGVDGDQDNENALLSGAVYVRRIGR